MRTAYILGAAIGWGTTMAVSAFINLWHAAWGTLAQITIVLVPFAFGGLLAFPAAMLAADTISRQRSHEVRFAAFFLCLCASTILFTALVYALQYRAYYAQWHGPILSIRWVYEWVFTVLGALYQFAVIGIRLYFPWGLLALFLASLLYARRSH